MRIVSLQTLFPWLALVAIGLFVVLRRILRDFHADRFGAEGDWPVVARPILSNREKEFFQRLEAVYPGHRIFVQVALSQLLALLPGIANGESIRAQFKQKVADFVICRRDFSVLAVVELDDKSHERADRQLADLKKSKAIASAGIPFFRVPAGPIPSEAQLRQLLSGGPAGLALVPEVSPLQRSAPVSETNAMMVPIVRLVGFVALLIAGAWILWNLFQSTPRPAPSAAHRIVPVPSAKPIAPPALAAAAPRVAPTEAPQEDPGLAIDQAMRAQEAATELATRKAAAWAAFYKPPIACEHPPAWADQVECGNQYMRARREFEKQWAAAEGRPSDSGSSRVTVGR